MNIEKLFHVLVLGGAALGLGACGDAKEGGAGGDGGAAGSDNGGNGGFGGAGGQGNGGAAGMSSGNGGNGGSAGNGAGGAAGAGGGSNLVCTTPASPGDACGCPCCWADNCLNTEECCAGFCQVGNNGAGCCGG